MILLQKYNFSNSIESFSTDKNIDVKISQNLFDTKNRIQTGKI